MNVSLKEFKALLESGPKHTTPLDSKRLIDLNNDDLKEMPFRAWFTEVDPATKQTMLDIVERLEIVCALVDFNVKEWNNLVHYVIRTNLARKLQELVDKEKRDFLESEPTTRTVLRT